MKKIAITGASGLVGSHLIRAIGDAGFQPIVLGRTPVHNLPFIPFKLGEPLEPESLKGIDVLVHCAYDFGPIRKSELEAINVQGSVQLLESAKAQGVSQIIFISSISAYLGCRSLYGQGKLKVEQTVQNLGGISIRPGLVFESSVDENSDSNNPRGMFGALSRITKLPVLPVFDGGSQPFYLVEARDLAHWIVGLISGKVSTPTQPVVLAHPQAIKFKDLLTEIASQSSSHKPRRPKFFSVPGQLALTGLKLKEALGLSGGFRSDSLLGLLHPNPRPDFKYILDNPQIGLRSFDRQPKTQ